MGFRIKIERRARSKFPEGLRDRQARLAAIPLELRITAPDPYQCAVSQLDTRKILFTKRMCIKGNASVHVPFVVICYKDDEAHVRQASDSPQV